MLERQILLYLKASTLIQRIQNNQALIAFVALIIVKLRIGVKK